MILSIPDNILLQANISADQFRTEIAVFLYRQQMLSIGQARKIAQLDLISFQKELARREVNIHYDVAELDKDLKNLHLSE